MADNELNQEEILHSEYLISHPVNVKKRILVLDIIIAILGVLGFCGMAVPPLVTGIRGSDNTNTIVGAVLMGIAVIWIILFIPICLNKNKKPVGVIFHLWVLLLVGGQLGLRVYQFINNQGVGIVNLIVYGVFTVFALFGLLLYLGKSKDAKIGRKYAAFTLTALSAAFGVAVIYANYVLPAYAAFQGLTVDASSLDWYFALIKFIGSVLAALNLALVVAALAGRLVDRGDNLVTIEKEVVEKEVTVEVIKEIPAKPRANGLVIIKSKKKEEEPVPEEVPPEDSGK